MDMFKKSGEFTPDSLFSGLEIAVLVRGITLKSGQGLLKRGSVLYKDTDGKYSLTKKLDDKPEAVLTDDADTENEVITTAFISGQFNKKALIFGDGISYEDFELHLRALNIFAEDILTN